MKKTNLILLVLVSSLSLHAQVFHGGITGGFTASQIDGDTYAGYDKPGLRGGVFIKTSLTDYFDARFEILYVSRGARNLASDNNTGAYRLELHYIDLPVLGAFGFKNLGSVEIGLVPGYLFAIHGEKDGGLLTKEDKADYHKFDLGTLVGIAINLTAKISINLRYSYSIFSIRDLESAGSYYSWFGKFVGHSKGDFNNYLSLGVNYLIR